MDCQSQATGIINAVITCYLVKYYNNCLWHVRWHDDDNCGMTLL